MPENQSALVWARQGRISAWPRTLKETASEIARRAKTADVYIGVGVGRPPAERARSEDKKLCNLRLTSDEVETWPAFVADLDVKGPGHKAKQGLFESVDEALEFSSSLNLPPSMTIRSGGGVQLWWAMKEPWELNDNGERAKARSYSYGWHRYLLEQAQEIGRTVDPIWDLGRVLRPPGTWNRKEGLERPVTGEDHGHRYNEDEFEIFCAEPPAEAIKAGDLILDPLATAPAHRLEMLIDVHDKLKATWLKQRDKELLSTSEYELSIANMLWGCGWSEQEIANTIIHWRRRHSEEVMLRAARFQATIGKAKASKYANEQRESLAVDTEVAEANLESRPPNIERDRILKQIKTRLGIPITAIHRVAEAYSVKLVGDRVFDIPSDTRFMNQDQWRVVAGRQRISLPAITNNAKTAYQWYRVLDLLFSIVEDMTTEDATPLGIVESIVTEGESRAQDITKLREYEQVGALDGLNPFHCCIILGRELGVSLKAAHGRIMQERGIKITRPELSQLMSQAGFVQRQWAIRVGEKTVNRRLWWRARKEPQ